MWPFVLVDLNTVAFWCTPGVVCVFKTKDSELDLALSFSNSIGERTSFAPEHIYTIASNIRVVSG